MVRGVFGLFLMMFPLNATRKAMPTQFSALVKESDTVAEKDYVGRILTDCAVCLTPKMWCNLSMKGRSICW